MVLKRALIYSSVLHGAILLLLIVNIQNPFRHTLVSEQPIDVLFLDVAEQRAAPHRAPAIPEKPTLAKPQMATVFPKPQAAPPPPPLPDQKAPNENTKEKETVVEFKPHKKPPQKPQRRPKAKALKAQVDVRKKKPPRRPLLDQTSKAEKKKVDQEFDSLMGTLSDEPERPEDTSFLGAPTDIQAPTITASEIDAVRQKIYRCWIVPSGAKDAKDLVVEINMKVARSGVVLEADIVDKTRMGRDSFFKAAAESARRAVLDPRCNPLPLPEHKYDQWKKLTFVFNPRDMF